MPIHTDKIHGVLSSPGFEGPQQLKGYIPCNKTTGGTANYRGGPNPAIYIPMGISGVTIGTGVDLGQTDAKTLLGFGLTEDFIAQFKPYLEKRKVDAVYALHKKPLEISKADADALDFAMLNHHINMIANYYDKATSTGTFETLPWQAQAAIVSIQYQRGVHSPRKYPGTWKHLITQNWAKAAADFKNPKLWNGYYNRRKLEGNLLAELC